MKIWIFLFAFGIEFFASAAHAGSCSPGVTPARTMIDMSSTVIFAQPAERSLQVQSYFYSREHGMQKTCSQKIEISKDSLVVFTRNRSAEHLEFSPFTEAKVEYAFLVRADGHMTTLPCFLPELEGCRNASSLPVFRIEQNEGALSDWVASNYLPPSPPSLSVAAEYEGKSLTLNFATVLKLRQLGSQAKTKTDPKLRIVGLARTGLSEADLTVAITRPVAMTNGFTGRLRDDLASPEYEVFLIDGLPQDLHVPPVTVELK